ncbi:hypothetical protein [Nocardia iowensis]|uniref:Uncharacterized protein n=1 Tax=Nocardia iowensis TaxID=204891 RepID=A0ABX8RGW9_NOCIO|nr:hypothetical protein [Nocardia iowensis]QXN88840.1 hypothetical protein KV110_25025 [Nocardia iowensis]
MQPGQLIAAGCGEHIPLSADQLREYGVVETEFGDQSRIVTARPQWWFPR